jgi:myo-inositol-1(or 4)-monophosphatase
MSKTISHSDLYSLAEIFKIMVNRFANKPVSVINFKARNDAVTELDLYLQNMIIEHLECIDPNVVCISEESVGSVTDEDVAWIIDPLDGTSNYIQGLDPSSISIAKVRGSEVLAALVMDISTMDVYSAVKGGGAYLNKKLIQPKDIEIRLIGTSTGYLKRSGAIPKGWNTRVIGSQAIQLCLVATGVLAANISYEAKAWDDVAGSLIVRESGGCYQYQNKETSWLKLAVSQQSIRSKAVTMKVNNIEKQKIMELVNE